MLQRIYWGIFLGVVISPVIFYALSLVISPLIIEEIKIKNLLIFSLFLSTVCLTVATLLYRKKVIAAKQPALSLMERLMKYKSALIIYLALNEAPAIISALFYMFTGSYLFMIITGIILINIFLKRPDKSRIFNELELNSSEQSELY
jgi:hypothetical protein